MIERAAGLARHDVAAVGHLQRVLTLCSHRRLLHRRLASRLDGRAPDLALGRHVRRGAPSRDDAWPAGRRRVAGHGAAAGQAPRHGDAAGRPADRRRRGGDAATLRRRSSAPLCIAEMRKTALDGPAAGAFNAQARASYGRSCGRELAAMAMPVARMEAALAAAGGPTTARGARPAARASGTTPSAMPARSAGAGRSSTSRPMPACWMLPGGIAGWRGAMDAGPLGRSLHEAARPAPRASLGVFTDIDDTLTPMAASRPRPMRRWRPRRQRAWPWCRSPGRPAGWCDMVARSGRWPAWSARTAPSISATTSRAGP